MSSAVVNNVATDWSKVEVTIAGQGLVLNGLKSISYGRTVDAAYAYGRGSKPYDYTDGVTNFEDVTLEMDVADWATLENTFGKEDIYKKTSQMDISVNYDLGDSNILGDTIVAFRVLSAKKNPQQGPDNITVQITGKCKDLK